MITLKRALGRWDLTALGVNQVIGGAIFLWPAQVAAQVGAWSPIGFILIGFLSLSVALCFAELSSRFDTTGGPYVNTTRAIELINREDGLVLDVRDAAEYGAGHILGARHLPLDRIDEGGGDLAKKKERPLIVYDDGGERSAKAAAALKRQGFTRVASLTGGLGAWRQAGLPVEK